ARARQQGLVRGDDMLAALEGCLDTRLCRTVLATHQLDEDVDVGLTCKRDGIIEPLDAGKVDAAVTSAVACGDRGDGDRPAALAGYFIPLRRQNARHRRTNGG